MDVFQIISGVGAGAFVTTLFQIWNTRKTEAQKRQFQEKKECYVGLLEAYHKAAVENTDIAAKNFAYWQMRCELVAPKEVRMAIVDIVNTNGMKEERNIAHENLKRLLRKDLNIAK